MGTSMVRVVNATAALAKGGSSSLPKMRYYRFTCIFQLVRARQKNKFYKRTPGMISKALFLIIRSSV